MMPFSKIANPYDEDAQRSKLLQARSDPSRRRSAAIIFGGCVALVLFAILALNGLPGSGVILVPIGLGMLVGGGIELVVGRLGS